MNILIFLITFLGVCFSIEEHQRYEYCFLSQRAWQDSSATIDTLLKHEAAVQPIKLLWRNRNEAYKVVEDPELRLCFSYNALPLDQLRLDKEVIKFKQKYRDGEITISNSLGKKPVGLKLTKTHTIRAHTQYWQLNEHLNLLFDPMLNKEIKLKFARHDHVMENNEYRYETLKKNRFISNDLLTIRAYYLHERLISFELKLKSGKTLNIMRGNGESINLRRCIEWLLNDQTAAAYSFYPEDMFNSSIGTMLFDADIETLP
jgi:hypothetical protein